MRLAGELRAGKNGSRRQDQVLQRRRAATVIELNEPGKVLSPTSTTGGSISGEHYKRSKLHGQVHAQNRAADARFHAINTGISPKAGAQADVAETGCAAAGGVLGVGV
jgi:hypothetical protein